jgi:hypothetical protein
MIEMVLNARTLPEPLFKLIQTEKVKVNETNGIINIIPIGEKKVDCPLLGLTSDSSMTVDKFLALTHDETEMVK